MALQFNYEEQMPSKSKRMVSQAGENEPRHILQTLQKSTPETVHVKQNLFFI